MAKNKTVYELEDLEKLAELGMLSIEGYKVLVSMLQYEINELRGSF